MSYQRWKALVLGLGGALLLAMPLAAQQSQGSYNILAVGGTTRFAESSAIADDFVGSLYGGIEANYNLRPNFALGGYLLASRPSTDGTMFPLIRMQFQDTVFYYTASQQLTLLEYGLQGVLTVPLGSLNLHGTAGAGRYRFDLSPERSWKPVGVGDEVNSMGGMSYVLGGGISVPLPGSGSLRLQVRDFVYTDYDRQVFDLSERLLSAKQIPHPRSEFPEAEETIHNLRFEAAVSFNLRGGS